MAQYYPSPEYYSRFGTATPSPQRPAYYSSAAAFAAATQRPATRATHTRAPSEYSPRPPYSPRYNSHGEYATANVSHTRTSRKQSFSDPSRERSKRERRNSYSYYRASDSHGESDEDEYIEIDGVTYVIPARSRSKRYVREYFVVNAGGYDTDHRYYSQGGRGIFERDIRDPREGYASPMSGVYAADRRPSGHSRHSSSNTIPRPMTARPSSSHKKVAPPPARRQATEADAKKYRIPAGYSLKNWDPSEEPIMLLGSVFDANSLGKWIYDWTVYHHGPATPIADMAGELWLMLINLAGKIRKAEETVPKIRTAENKDMVEDFIESGDRLTDKLRKLLKSCEAPMLKAAQQKNNGQLGKDAGVEFVLTLFGRDRELDRTERFMQSVRLWNLRFDANCGEILAKPYE